VYTSAAVARVYNATLFARYPRRYLFDTAAAAAGNPIRGLNAHNTTTTTTVRCLTRVTIVARTIRWITKYFRKIFIMTCPRCVCKTISFLFSVHTTASSWNAYLKTVGIDRFRIVFFFDYIDHTSIGTISKPVLPFRFKCLIMTRSMLRNDISTVWYAHFSVFTASIHTYIYIYIYIDVWFHGIDTVCDLP